MTQPDFWDLPSSEPPATPVRTEKQRLIASARRVLAYLKLHGSALNWELASPDCGGLRFGGRLKELRDDGWEIETTRVENGTFRYTLKGLR